MEAISMLNAKGEDVPIFGSFPQTPFLLVYATQNPFLLLLGGPLAWGLINWVGAMGLAFAPVRNLFAYAFDGMLPEKLNEVNRRGSPVYRRSAWLHHFMGPVYGQLHHPPAFRLSGLHHHDLVLRLDLPEHRSHGIPLSPQGYLGEGSRDHPPEHLQYSVDRDRRRGWSDHQPGCDLLYPRSGIEPAF